ncbi:LD-carboxypeptidase [Rubrivirga sp. IMCC43871]|uniref:S66 peptidase family protein n=1 Tax=Rubrivirga sp. IMCC43871 TaxID=3391575 RepID=UPI00398F9310
MNRRHFLTAAGLATAGLSAPASLATVARPQTPTKPPRVRPGDTVGLVAPAGIVYRPSIIDEARANLASLGLQTVAAPTLLARDGYFAGTDRQRADAITAMFADDRVDAVMAMRGGWGAARALPFVDWDVVRANPKVLCGFSDNTSLLLAAYARTGLVTFHGPNATSEMGGMTGDSFRRVVMDGTAATLRTTGTPLSAPTPITPGRATGRLVGGNLSVLASLVGTEWMPDLGGHILFVEDIGEGIYRIDRMLTQLGQAGLLAGLAGFVFGVCPRCDPDSGEVDGFTLDEVVRQHIAPLGVPAFQGASIGHTSRKLTVPIGAEAEIDAAAGTLRLVAPAVA